MDQYIVSARKYRPSAFDAVVGQRHIGETLKNAIRSNHLAQAFLFSGPRGVGKTTCARILAKTINCLNRSDEVEACEECASCQSFNEGHSLNIYELDAASNNSVDDIRSLIDQVRFAPQLGTKKVYIIDEVHMLSASAFNAFLKTLEEPPAHAIFILATTEKHKIIPTILSRCQVFDFNRIDIEGIVRRLEEIAGKENVTVENEALHLIAQKSDGSLRDALSMFDQMVTYSGDNLTYASVIDNLSILDSDYFFTITDYLISGDISSTLNTFDDILQKGFDGHHFILDFAQHLRNLLVAQDHRTIELITAGQTIRDRFTEQTKRVSSTFLIHGLNLLSKADIGYKSSRNQRLLVEITLMNLAAKNAGASSPSETNSVASNSTIPNIPEKKKLEPAPVAKSKETVQEATKKEAIEEEPVIRAAEKTEELITDKSNETIEKGQKEEPTPKIIDPTEVKPEITSEKKAIHEEIEKTVQSPTSKAKTRYNPDVVSDTISIKDFTEPKAKYNSSDEAGNEGPKRNTEVTVDLLKEAWKELLTKLDESGKLNLFATLSKYDPAIDENHNVIATYDNSSQVETINSERLSIVEFLRNKLQNDHINLTLKISDQEYQKAYTPTEKLQQMIDENPSISKLKDKLDLDLGL